METVLKVFNCSLTSGSNGIKVSAVLGFLCCESFHKSIVPSCLGCGQRLIDAMLGVVAIFPKGGDEGLMPVFVVDSVAQLADSRASDVLGQGSNCFSGESVFPVINEGEATLGICDGDFGEFQDLGRHLEIDLGSKHFAVLKHVIGRRRGDRVEVGNEDDLAGRVVEVDGGGRHWNERMLTFFLLVVGLYPCSGCFM